MEIQVFEHDDYWRARIAGKGWKSFRGRTMQEAIGHVVWYNQAQFQDGGIAFHVHYADGTTAYWDVFGARGYDCGIQS